MPRMSQSHPTSRTPLYGLVLAGGRGTRLKADKGALRYHGAPQARWAHDLLTRVCQRVFVSVRPDQADLDPYRDLPLIVDTEEGAGPAAGLTAALHRFPAVAWLLLAADMPLVEPVTLRKLVVARDPEAVGTAYKHADGAPEPLCAIFEPKVLAAMAVAGTSAAVSLRQLLEAGPAKLVALSDTTPLASVNTQEDDARVRRALAERSR